MATSDSDTNPHRITQTEHESKSNTNEALSQNRQPIMFDPVQIRNLPYRERRNQQIASDIRRESIMNILCNTQDNTIKAISYVLEQAQASGDPEQLKLVRTLYKAFSVTLLKIINNADLTEITDAIDLELVERLTDRALMASYNEQ